MDENVVVIAFSEESRAYEGLARLKQLAAEDQIGRHDGDVVEPRTARCTCGMRPATSTTASGCCSAPPWACWPERSSTPAKTRRPTACSSTSRARSATIRRRCSPTSARAARRPWTASCAEIDGNLSRFDRKDAEAGIAGAEKAAHEARVKACKELRHERRETTVEKVQAKVRERLGQPVQH
jgi:hypothetical protein